MVDSSGSSKVHIPTLQTKMLAVDASGASNVTGSTDKQNLNISGASSYNAAGLKSVSAKVDFSGASQGSVNAQRVNGDLSGVSKLNLHGKPNNIDVSTSEMSRWHVIN